MKRLLVFASLLAICQLADYLAIHYLKCTLNSWFLFGLFGSNVVVFGLSFLVLIIGFLYLKPHISIPLLAVLSGGISNLIDRITYGSVVDYIKLPGWPVFNLADALIVVGIFIFTCQMIQSDQQKIP